MNTSNANVYVFNVFSETLTLSTNGGTAGTIADWTNGASVDNLDPKYRPNSIAVPRTLNASDGMGKFFNGTHSDPPNDVGVHWQENPVSFQLSLHKYPMTQDLLLFITENTWRLVDQFGTEQDAGPLSGGGQPAAGGSSGG